MSIYPVKISEWFPPGDEMYEIASGIVSIKRCYACNKKARWKAAIGHHSLPWGYGDVWCSVKCLKSRKEHKLDKRQRRKLRRVLGKQYNTFITITTGQLLKEN